MEAFSIQDRSLQVRDVPMCYVRWLYVTYCYISSMKSSVLQEKIIMWKESMYKYLNTNTKRIHWRLCSKEKIGNHCKNVTYGLDTKPYVTHYYVSSIGISVLQGKFFMWKGSMYRYLKTNNNGFTAGYVFGEKTGKCVRYGFVTNWCPQPNGFKKSNFQLLTKMQFSS